MISQVYLTGPVRTAIGTFNGSLAEIPATALGSTVIKAAIERAKIPFDQIDEVIMGNVLSAGLGQNPARQASIGAGLAPAVGATTVGKVCGSGLKAVTLAAQAIQCGDASAIVAGGMESMSRSPYLLEKARNGYRMGNGELVDAMLRDGLIDAYEHVHMGTFGEQCAAKNHFSREQQDDYAIESYQRALAAIANGAFAAQIVPMNVPVVKEMVLVAEDEQPKRFNEEKLRKLKPVFSKDGSITAGNAPGINDGAAAVLVISAEKAKALGIKPVARILGYASAAREPQWFTTAPIDAIRKLLAKLSLKSADVDLFEINEAFSVVAMAAMKELSIPHDKINIFGGAVALGHPIGASGARTLVTLIHALQQRSKQIGVTALCIGGGEAVAMAVELI
jgi:acetyl-CoA C-acetyltransferase